MSTLYWTSHARTRAREMEVSEEEVEQALDSPELSYPNALGHPAGTTYVRGRIAIPVATDGAILTVLWHRGEGR